MPLKLSNGSIITDWDIKTVNLTLWELSPDSNIITKSIMLRNYSTYDELNGQYGVLDYPCLQSQSWVEVYNATFTEHVRIYPVSEVSIERGGFDSDCPIVVFDVGFNATGVEYVIWTVGFLTTVNMDVIYITGGWPDFTDRMMDFVGVSIIYIMIIGSMGRKFGAVGGGFGSIICAVILITLGNPALNPLIIFMFTLAIIMFLVGFKKMSNDGNVIEMIR